MCSTRKLRRNDVVLFQTALSWWIPARVINRESEDTVRIVDSLGRVTVIHDRSRHLDVVHRYDESRYIFYGVSGLGKTIKRPVPSLRRLKQKAAWYTPSVWRSRKRGTYDKQETRASEIE